MASGLLLIVMAVLSMGGNGWIAVIPVLVCALGAAVQRFRNRLTWWGAGFVAVAGSGVLVWTAFAMTLALRGELTEGGTVLSLASAANVVADAVDRVVRPRRHRAATGA